MTPQKQTELIIDLLKQLNNKLPENSKAPFIDIHADVDTEISALTFEKPAIEDITQQ